MKRISRLGVHYYYRGENHRHFRKSRMSLKLVKQDANQDGDSQQL